MLEFNDLPREIQLEVFKHITPAELWANVRRVCKAFHDLLTPDSYWLLRAQAHGLHLPERLKKQSSHGDPDDVSACTRAVRNCEAIESTLQKWRNEDYVNNPRVTHIHYGNVDAIHLFDYGSGGARKTFCCTGSRDRTILLWDFDAVFKENSSEKWIASRVDNAHKGWIWSMCTKNDTELYSLGWDSMVKQWHIAESKIISGCKLTTTTAALSCAADGDHLLYVSTYSDGLLLCDTRDGLSVAKRLTCHSKMPVIEIATDRDTNYIYSIGADHAMAMIDKRTFTLVKETHFENSPFHIKYYGGYLALSFSSGQLWYMNPEELTTEKELPLPVEENNRVRHLFTALSLGAIYTAYENSLRVYTGGMAPELIASHELEMMPSNIECFKGSLVCASKEGSVSFWR